MDMLVDIVEEIRANYVTRTHLGDVVSRLASKEDLRLLETKVGLELQTIQVKLEHVANKEELSHYSTKEDLQQAVQSIRNWVLGMGMTLFFSLAGLQFAMFQLYSHAR
ncbi:hypothetical protein [Rugamonas sp.]|uniref:hypothetical protein n=1 Tax=Rugamonas sp. TaxID=1926287 RepID=UPI0025F87361|nr:hypothetical protein [Rugamonas sp.]